MFTLNQIKDAHSKVKSGADFPRYVQDLIQLGVTGYSTFVTDGHTLYQGNEGFELKSDPKYAALPIAATGDKETFIRNLRHHQQGGSDYPTFCKQAAEGGVEKWTVDTTALTCTYYDKAGNEMLVEKVPTP